MTSIENGYKNAILLEKDAHICDSYSL